MLLRVEFRVSVASSRAISQIVVFVILQTIALPTELPRRSPHFTRKLASEPNVWATNGVAAIAQTRPMVLAIHAQAHRDHWSQAIAVRSETIVRLRPCAEPSLAEVGMT